MDTRISFFKYVIAQNNYLYKAAGVIDDPVNKQKYFESNYARNKFIIDIILLMMYAFIISFILMSFINLIVPILSDYYYNLYYGAYNPNAGFERMLIKVLQFLFFTVTSFLVIPITMKLLRCIFGTRLFLMKFKNAEDMDGKRKYKDYFEFYNNNVAVHIDNIFYREGKKAESLRMGYFKNELDDWANLNKVRRIYNFLLFIAPFIAVIVFFEAMMSGAMELGVALFTLLLVVVLMILSHIPAVIFWKRYKRGMA